jgi:phosphatidylethanolamine-binding protein (PEBP) family uncharacterized protein
MRILMHLSLSGAVVLFAIFAAGLLMAAPNAVFADYQPVWMPYSVDLNWGFNDGFGDGALEGEAYQNAKAAAIAKLLSDIKEMFGDTSKQSDLVTKLVASLNTTAAQKYIANNPVFKQAMVDLGLLGNSKKTTTSPDQVRTAAKTITDTKVNKYVEKSNQGDKLAERQYNGLITEDSYRDITDPTQLAAYLKSQGYKQSGNTFVASNGVTDTVASAWYAMLRNGGNGLSPFTDDPACSRMVNGKLDTADWLGDGPAETPGTPNTPGTPRTSETPTVTKVKPSVTNTTNAAQSTAKVSMSVATNPNATCKYSLISGFSYSAGTAFDTTGNYNHNTDLNNMANGKHTYYVLCEDVATKGMSEPETKIEFTVDLSQDPANKPVINNETPAIQTDAAPKLLVTTTRAAVCQYKEGVATLEYGSGITMAPADANHRAHSVSIAALADGDRSFAVVCKDDATGAVSDVKVIETSLNRVVVDNTPVITNKTVAFQNTLPAAILLTTTRNADCKYKSGTFTDFTDAAAVKFSATPATTHAAQLSGLADGSYTYNVICSDTASGKKNDPAFEVKFTVSAAIPDISSNTPAVQTGSDSKLSVTTVRPADCQYKKDITFDFGAGAALPAANNNLSHEISISTLADGTYSFHVVCVDKSSNRSAEKVIETKIDTPVIDIEAPVVTNRTVGYQTVNDPVLWVETSKDSECEYSAGLFDWGEGTKFKDDGVIVHKTELSDLPNGQHGYYVICNRLSNNKTSPKGYQIIFTVNTVADTGVCASLVSNDRKNDSNRDSRNIGADSVYPWQSVETGTREIFAKVDWYGGYQFTSEKDGQVTQLCGYFDTGVKNKIALYNGTFSELASTEITGDGKWKCADVDPVEIKMDGRYYVITRVKNNSMYFEYNESGLFPVDAGGVVIESGIRQTFVNGKFKTDIVKYDYMIFGLVDVKINFKPLINSGPEITSVGPSGTVYDSNTSITASTEAGSTCRFGREDVDYADMPYSLPKVTEGSYSQKVCGLEDGNYTFYVRCEDVSGEENNASKPLRFMVEQ